MVWSLLWRGESKAVVVSEGRDFSRPFVLCAAERVIGRAYRPMGLWRLVRGAAPLAGMDRAVGALDNRICAAMKESQYGGFSTALRFGRNDSIWGGVEESGRALLDTPPFRKKRERVGHPDCAAPKYRDPSPSATLRVRMKASWGKLLRLG